MSKELILGKQYDCLDKGFVRVVDVMGDDAAIVQAARVSYGTGTKTAREDAELINFLMRHDHTSPFEMCEIKFHCKMPIFVARQWIRHRTANVNEYSGRYSVMKDEFYIPHEGNVKAQSNKNKQASDGLVETLDVQQFLAALELQCQEAYANYQLALDKGIARETAREGLPLNIYTEWYWKIDLHNLLHFLRLRLDPHAQYEIRVFADAMSWIVKDWTPAAWNAFEEYKRYSIRFSRKEQILLANVLGFIAGFDDRPPEGFSKGEFQELKEKIILIHNRANDAKQTA